MVDVFCGILVSSDQVVVLDFDVALFEVKDVRSTRLELEGALKVELVVCPEEDAGGVLDLWREVFSSSVQVVDVDFVVVVVNSTLGVVVDVVTFADVLKLFSELVKVCCVLLLLLCTVNVDL